MSLLEALILGIVQGATEFLPISSSGHLVLTEALLGISGGGLLIEVTLHLGTLLAVLIYFRRRIVWLLTGGVARGEEGERARRWLLWLALGTIPAVVVGLGLRGAIEQLFESTTAALVGLLVTGGILFSSRWSRARGRSAVSSAALFIGLGQALAIMPGISRSGTTIAAGMWLGVDRTEAAEFSFLLSIPAIAGAALLQTWDLISGSAPDASMLAGALLPGFAAAFISGYAAIAGLLGILKRRGLVPFAWYCWAVALAGLVFIRI